jgi:hypothetical protein
MDDFYVSIPLKVSKKFMPGKQYHVRPFTEVSSTQSFQANKNLSFNPARQQLIHFFSMLELKQSRG